MTAHEPKIIAPRAGTPVPHLHDSRRTSGSLPDVLVSDQVERLALFSAVAAGLWTIGFLMDRVIVPLAVGVPVRSPASDTAIEIVAIVANVAMFAYARFANHSSRRKADAGLALMLLNSALIALLNTWSTRIRSDMMPLSWITIVILVFSMIVPTTPRKMLLASLAAASMDPLAVWLAHLRGLPVPSVAFVLTMFIPNYSCAVVATLPARVLQRMGRRLREAQEMGSYQLVELLGKGGMGEVWRAEHRLLARQAAVKLVRPDLLGAGDEEGARLMLRRFEREAQATASLSSPHTIHVFDFGVTDDGTFYYVMELLAGRDLESLVREFGPVPADRAMFLLRQVCHSLADAHARSLVHRDIKPANIYVCRMGLEYDFVKVLDFGLVRFGERSSMFQTSLTVEHKTSGTPAYMAPEVILGEADVDRRADVYALGCVAYYLLTGRLVFEADTPMKMLMQHVQATPIAPSLRSELPVPRELDELVLACLEKDPAKRPQNADELFQIACSFTTCDGWQQSKARNWWERHLPDLTGPLTVGEPGMRAGRSIAIH